MFRNDHRRDDAQGRYNLSKKTQKRNITGGELAAIGTLGILSIARVVKDRDDVGGDPAE